ncbi:ABATE domain-containing protein, partial [Actinoplanes sp. NPDC048791]|uniref:ABATE domain-containing protein n=1 Tax=Actinoplanes sp. NPDC048791 TaxID=3154623 RepID=UPI0033E219A7
MNDVTSTGGVADLVRNGGLLCLDFINTVEPRTGPVDREWLTGYADLVVWARHGDLLDEAAVDALLRTAADRPAEARAAYRAAIDLREGLFRLFAAIVDGSTPADGDLEVLRRAYAAATAHGRLVPSGGGFGWAWDAPESRGRAGGAGAGGAVVGGGAGAREPGKNRPPPPGGSRLV